VVVAVRSASTGCSLPAPTITVPPQLATTGVVGGTPLDAGDTQGLRDLAAEVASAVGGGGFGSAQAEAPAGETALDASRHNATVVPITLGASGSPPVRRLAGLVVFLDDCQGRHYLAAFRDLSREGPPWHGAIGVAGSPLVYDTDPATPMQRSADGRLTPAI
jgi:hypothetical protein